MLTSLIARQRKIFSKKTKILDLINPIQRNFGTSIYLWAAGPPRIGPKAGSITNQFAMKRGVPERVEIYDDLNVKSLKIGMRHSAVISEDGGLYTFGMGNWGVLGHGNEQNLKHTAPKRVEKFDKLGLKVVDVALGESHTMAMTDDGSIWTWGYAGKKGYFNWMYSQEIGALGHGDKEPHFLPMRVDYFKENNIKIKKINAGLYFCNVITEDNELYVWGRGLYGVLGNGANSPELSPVLNEDLKIINDEDPSNPFVRIESADEFTVAQQKDGTLYAWGKNDRGQMGVPQGIGMDMIDSASIPTQIELLNENEQLVGAKDFYLGQNTMIIKDDENNIYLSGLKLHYTPKQLNFDPEIIDKDKIDLIACGVKHFVMTSTDYKIMTWGRVFKEKNNDDHTEGFEVHNQDSLFDDGIVRQIEARYGIFGALVEH